MINKPKIVYVLGDGRSGSTMLDSILASKENSISIGEGYRFWERYYKATTKCGCDTLIAGCEFWNKVHLYLEQAIPDYNPDKIKRLINKYTSYKESVAINKGYLNEEIQFLFSVIAAFYRAMEVSNPGVAYIVDSSKSPGWAILLSKSGVLDIKFIHLERDLTSVASSWKKRLVLPEFVDKNIFMPIKSDANIIRTWIRVKLLSNKLAVNKNYFFLEYSHLCNDKVAMNDLNTFLNWDLQPPFISKVTHAIAGNPSRSKGTEIKIRAYQVSKDHLSAFQIVYFTFIYKMSKLLIK